MKNESPMHEIFGDVVSFMSQQVSPVSRSAKNGTTSAREEGAAPKRSGELEIETDGGGHGGWRAWVAGTLDCDWDGENYVSKTTMGEGATEAEAIADLQEKLHDDEEHKLNVDAMRNLSPAQRAAIGRDEDRVEVMSRGQGVAL